MCTILVKVIFYSICSGKKIECEIYRESQGGIIQSPELAANFKNAWHKHQQGKEEEKLLFTTICNL